LNFWKSEIFFILGLDNDFRKSEVICPSGQVVAAKPGAARRDGLRGAKEAK
jgi:hypothetical protein